MTRIDDEYLVTDEASVAVMWHYHSVGYFHPVSEIWGVSPIRQLLTWDGFPKIRIPRPLVLKLIEPVEGEAVIWELDSHGDSEGLVLLSADEAADPIYKDDIKYNWRVVNICQSYGELRELVEWEKLDDESIE